MRPEHIKAGFAPSTASEDAPCGRCGSVGEERGDPERSTPERFIPCRSCSPTKTHQSYSGRDPESGQEPKEPRA